MTTYQPLDVIRVSAKVTEAKIEPNRSVEVTKLIDVSKCIGCKACQSACLEWNDKRGPVGVNDGVYENPRTLLRICSPSCVSPSGTILRRAISNGSSARRVACQEWEARTSCTCCITPTSRKSMPDYPQIRGSVRSSRHG